MNVRGRRKPRTPYSSEYANRRGLTSQIGDINTRLRGVELRGPPDLIHTIMSHLDIILDRVPQPGDVLTFTPRGFAAREPVAAISGITIRKNSGTDVGTRPRINLIEGADVAITVADDEDDDELDVTISFSGAGAGGVVHYDAVVDWLYSGADADPVTLATDSIVKRFSEIQPAIDDYYVSPPSPDQSLSLRINRGQYGDVLIDDNQPGPIVIVGEPGVPINGFTFSPVEVGSVVIQSSVVYTVMRDLRIAGAIEAGAGAFYDSSSEGLLIELRKVYVSAINGAFSNSIFEDVWIDGWALNDGWNASNNVLTSFTRVTLSGGIYSDSGTDSLIPGIYSFTDCYLNGALGGFPAGYFKVGTNKHFVFNNCVFNGSISLEIDPGVVMILELNDCLINTGIYVIGGGTLRLTINGLRCGDPTGGLYDISQVIDGDATTTIIAVVDGVQAGDIGFVTSPLFRGQFVDSYFGSCSPPSYDVEFL